jgi:hypothetical protein
VALTFAQLQGALNRGVGPWVALADVNEAVFLALTTLGYSPTNPQQITDADLVTVPWMAFLQIRDIAEWRMLESIANNASDAELRRIGLEDDPDRARTLLRERAAAKFSYVQRAYGVGLPTLKAGVLDLNASQQDIPGVTINY